MARQNLGRVVPLWKGEYSATATYTLNDLVRDENGSTYWHYEKSPTTGVPVTDTTVWAVLYDHDAMPVLLEKNVAYAAEITIPANRITKIATLAGAVDIAIAEGKDGLDNEWSFQVTQGETAYDVVLPEVYWGLGIAPVFGANSTTVCRLYYVGDILCGEWVDVPVVVEVAG